MLLVHRKSCIANILFCFFILLGKVHGSLARAGKVKGQTPKVSIAFKFGNL